MGTADPRWLWPEFARFVRVLRPRYVLVENVPGLLVGGGMAQVLGDLAACGYDAEWDCFPAAAVGAPHLRYRVFLVAYTPKCAGRVQSIRRPECGGPPVACHNGEEGGVADAPRQLFDGAGALFTRSPQPPNSHWWATEPDVGRVAHGVPARVDRLRALGNAVVPQVAEWVGRRIMEAD